MVSNGITKIGHMRPRRPLELSSMMNSWLFKDLPSRLTFKLFRAGYQSFNETLHNHI
jgi:hypothetical protein